MRRGSRSEASRGDCSKRVTIAVSMSAFPVTRHSIVAAIRSQQPDVRRSAFDALVDGLLEAGVQVRAAQVARVARRRGGSDAGILPARVREGFLRRLRSVAGAVPHLPPHLSRRLRVQRAEGRRAAEAGRRRDARPDRLRRSRARAAASGDERDRRLRRLFPPRVAARPVRGRGGTPARRLRRARARRTFHRLRAVRSGRRRSRRARPTPTWRGVSASRRST